MRYNTYFHIIQETIPLFRTTQWFWFSVAIFYTYSDFVVEMIKSNTSLHHLLDYVKWQQPLAFWLIGCGCGRGWGEEDGVTNVSAKGRNCVYRGYFSFVSSFY